MPKSYRLRGRIWIEGPEGTFLGYGRVVLLERIRDYGSISATVRSMKMSYRHAWMLVESMNNQSAKPVVEKTTGGKGGGGQFLPERASGPSKCSGRRTENSRHFWQVARKTVHCNFFLQFVVPGRE